MEEILPNVLDQIELHNEKKHKWRQFLENLDIGHRVVKPGKFHQRHEISLNGPSASKLLPTKTF